MNVNYRFELRGDLDLLENQRIGVFVLERNIVVKHALVDIVERRPLLMKDPGYFLCHLSCHHLAKLKDLWCRLCNRPDKIVQKLKFRS